MLDVWSGGEGGGVVTFTEWMLLAVGTSLAYFAGRGLCRWLCNPRAWDDSQPLAVVGQGDNRRALYSARAAAAVDKPLEHPNAANGLDALLDDLGVELCGNCGETEAVIKCDNHRLCTECADACPDEAAEILRRIANDGRADARRDELKG